jgi:hypothetical protein
MRLRPLTISALLTFSLAGCATDGDFCAVYQPVAPLSTEMARELVEKNRASAVSIAANETTYRRECVG